MNADVALSPCLIKSRVSNTLFLLVWMNVVLVSDTVDVQFEEAKVSLMYKTFIEDFRGGFDSVDQIRYCSPRSRRDHLI